MRQTPVQSRQSHEPPRAPEITAIAPRRRHKLYTALAGEGVQNRARKAREGDGFP
jgi:hypothetical protein